MKSFALVCAVAAAQSMDMSYYQQQYAELMKQYEEADMNLLHTLAQFGNAMNTAILSNEQGFVDLANADNAA